MGAVIAIIVLLASFTATIAIISVRDNKEKRERL